MLSKKTTERLTSALTRVKAAQEFQACLITPAAPSAETQARIKAALCRTDAADKVIAILTSGQAVLPLDAQRRVMDMMAHEDAGEELLLALQGVPYKIK